MPPIVKENETLATTEAPARSTATSNGDAGAKAQPVALEVAVTVNGARAIEGSDKREPFSETTKTVLIFGNGAVIRLTSTVAPGQLLFLTNERTKKEVVCQVVKSKNYRNVSGYVELEFTEPVVGFWGMRFPGDRLGPGPQATPAVVNSAAPLRPAVAPPASVTLPPPPPAPKPAELKPTVFDAPLVARPEAPATFLASPSAESNGSFSSSIVPPPIDSGALLGASKPKAVENSLPEAPVTVAPQPVIHAPIVKAPAAPVAPAPAEPESLSPATRNFDQPNPAHEAASILAPAQKDPTTIDLSSLASLFEEKPAALASVAPPAPSLTPAPKESPKPESHLPTSPNFDLPRKADEPASIFAPAPKGPGTVDLSSLAPFFDVKPGASTPTGSAVPPKPAASDPETEDLKQHTARLQEQLSSLLFSEQTASAPSKPVKQAPEVLPVPPARESEGLKDGIAQVLEMTKTSAPAPRVDDLFAAPEKLVNSAPEKKGTSLDEEELKIPAWLEPLARNASAPSSTQELILREKAKRLAEQNPQAEDSTETAATPVIPAAEEESIPKPRMPEFGAALPIDEEKGPEQARPQNSSNSLLFVTIGAVAVLAVAGGWWYLNQLSSNHAGVEAVPAANVSRPVVAPPVKPQPETPAPSVKREPESPVSSAATAKTSEAVQHSNAKAAPANLAPASVHSVQPAPATPAKGNSAPAANTHPAESVAEAVEVKKPALGDVRLATPKVTKKQTVQSSAEPDGVSLQDGETVAAPDALGAGLAGSKQPAAPAAPLEVGGDVKQAKLISSVAPVYPVLAKNQHVSGNVTIDALIDVSGRVTTMKVISGPTLLHQSAMDALKQWKYQPAMLDGKPVAMHLTVTLQFRLQ